MFTACYLLLTNEMPLSLSEAKVRTVKTGWLRNERLKDVRDTKQNVGGWLCNISIGRGRDTLLMET